MASDKKFDIYDLAFTAPWAFFGDVFILVGLAALLIPILGIPIFAVMFMLNFLIIVGLLIWFSVKWRRIAKQDGVGVSFIFGSLITWAVFIAGVALLGLLFPTKLISLFLSAGLTNHYKGAGKVGDLALDAVLIFVPGPGWGGLALKEGGEVAAKEAVEVAAKKIAARQTEKIAAREIAAEAAEAGEERAIGRLGRLREASGDYVKDQAKEYAGGQLAGGSADGSEERMPWEEKSEFEKLHEYFETVPGTEPQKEDGSEEGDVVIDDDQNEVDLRKS